MRIQNTHYFVNCAKISSDANYGDLSLLIVWGKIAVFFYHNHHSLSVRRILKQQLLYNLFLKMTENTLKPLTLGMAIFDNAQLFSQLKSQCDGK